MTENNDDLDLAEFAETEDSEETPGNGSEPKPQKTENQKVTDDSIIASDTLISAAKRMGGFGLSGETREAFEDEFEGLARLATKIFGVDEASKIMSLKGSLSDETRLLGGILTVAGGAALWRWVINKDLEKGGKVKSTNPNPGGSNKTSSEKTDKANKSDKNKNTENTENTDDKEENDENPGDSLEFNGNFHDKKEKEGDSE